MASFQPYNVTIFIEGFAGRQLCTFTTERNKTEFIYFIEDNGGVLIGEWYKFTVQAQFLSAIRKNRELGGICYDLPVNSRESLSAYGTRRLT